MADPTTWEQPTTGGTITGVDARRMTVAYAGGYWFALHVYIDGTVAKVGVRWSSAPADEWVTANLPTPPTGTLQSPVEPEVVHGDGVWAFLVDYGPTPYGGTHRIYVYYTTDPTDPDSWTLYEVDLGSTAYAGMALTYAGGQWVLGGCHQATRPWPAFVAYATTLTGTWTVNTSYATTGYDPSILTSGHSAGNDSWMIWNIDYADGTWVTSAYGEVADEIVHRVVYSTSLTSDWATATDLGNTTDKLTHVDGYWLVRQRAYTSWDYVAGTPDGTWAWFGPFITDPYGDLCGDLILAQGNWVLAGSTWSDSPSVTTPNIWYATATGGPDTTYTAIDGFTGTAMLALGYDRTQYLVAGSDTDSTLWVCTLPVARPSYLRQRQSPRGNPTRVNLVR